MFQVIGTCIYHNKIIRILSIVGRYSGAESKHSDKRGGTLIQNNNSLKKCCGKWLIIAIYMITTVSTLYTQSVFLKCKIHRFLQVSTI